MKSLNKTLLFLFLMYGWLINAADTPPPPTPPDTEYGVGPGAPTPIDMYDFILVAVAVVFIVYFMKKYRKRLA